MNKISFVPIAIGIGIAIAGGLWGFLSFGVILAIFVVCGILLMIPVREKEEKKEIKYIKNELPEIIVYPIYKTENGRFKKLMVSREVDTYRKELS